jgi:hypothetical protein
MFCTVFIESLFCTGSLAGIDVSDEAAATGEEGELVCIVVRKASPVLDDLDDGKGSNKRSVKEPPYIFDSKPDCTSLSEEASGADKMSGITVCDIESCSGELGSDLKIEGMNSILSYYDQRQDDIRAKEIFASFEAIDSYMERHGISDKNPVQIKQSIDSYFRELKDSLLKVYHNNPTLRDILVTPINLAMICLISTDQEILQEFKGDFNAGKLYEEVVYWLGKRYMAKFKEMAPEDIVKERVFNLDELSVLEQAAHEKFSVNKVLISGRYIDTLTHDKDKSHELSIRHINKYSLLKPETSKTLHNVKIRLHSQPSDAELTNPQNANKVYLCYDKQTNSLSYAALKRNCIERKSITQEAANFKSPETLKSITTAITKAKVKSINKLVATL